MRQSIEARVRLLIAGREPELVACGKRRRRAAYSEAPGSCTSRPIRTLVGVSWGIG